MKLMLSISRFRPIEPFCRLLAVAKAACMRTAYSLGPLPKVLAGQDDLWRKRRRAPTRSVSFRRTVSRNGDAAVTSATRE
jgi:hypothetical protein